MTNSEVIEMLEAEWRDRLKAAVLAEREAIAKMVEPWLLHEYVEKIRNREQA